MVTKTEGIRIILKDKETDKPLGGIPVNIKVSANNFEKTKKTDDKWGEATFETKEGFSPGEDIVVLVNPGAYFGYEEIRNTQKARVLPGLVTIRRYSMGPSEEGEEDDPKENKDIKARIQVLKATHAKRRPGEEQTVTFGLQNRGSKNHKFYISAAISSPQEAGPTQDTDYVREDKTNQITLSVKVPTDIPKGKKTITVSVFEDENRKILKDKKTTTFTIEGTPTSTPKAICDYVDKATRVVRDAGVLTAIDDWVEGTITTGLRSKVIDAFHANAEFEECTPDKWAMISKLKVSEPSTIKPGERVTIKFFILNTGKETTDITFRWGVDTPSVSSLHQAVKPGETRSGSFRPPATNQEGLHRVECETRVGGEITHGGWVRYAVEKEEDIEKEISAEIKEIWCPGGTVFTSPGRAPANITVLNTGNKEHTFALGMSLINGQTVNGFWKKVDLLPSGEHKEKIVTLGMEIPENIKEGSHKLKVGIWKTWEGGTLVKEEEAWKGGVLKDLLDSNETSVTVKASDVPEPPRPTEDPQRSWWDDVLTAIGRVPDDVTRLIDGVLVFIGGGTLEAAASFVCVSLSRSSPGSLEHRRCMANFPMNLFLEDYWILAYGTKPDGSHAEPTHWNRAFLAIIFVPGSVVSRGVGLTGGFIFSGLRGLSVPALSKLGPGLSKLWKALPVLNRAESQAVKTGIEKGHIDDVAKILDDAGQLVTPEEWWTMIRRTPSLQMGGTTWAIKYVDDLAKEGIDFAPKYYKIITQGDIIKSKAVWGEWYTQMIKVLPFDTTNALMKSLKIDKEIIKTQIGSVAFKTYVKSWDDLIALARKTGMSDKQIASAWMAVGKDGVAKAVVSGAIKGAGKPGFFKRAAAWFKGHPNTGTWAFILMPWIIIDNLLMQIFTARVAGALPKEWGDQWDVSTNNLAFVYAKALEGNPCHKGTQQRYVDGLTELYNLIDYAENNPPSENILISTTQNILRVYGFSIGNPLEVIAESNRGVFEGFVTIYLQYVHQVHAWPKGSKPPCEDWVQLPEEWGIIVSDHITEPDDDEEPKQPVPEEITCMIREVLDGDTVRILYDDEEGSKLSDTVRLVGINSPETSHSKKMQDGSFRNYPAEPFATESKTWLAKKIGGLHGVTILTDKTKPRDDTEDRRILGAIFLNYENGMYDEYINLESVRAGWSAYYPYSANKHVLEKDFMEAQDAAIEARIGMWSGGYATLKVSSNPSGAQVFINGIDREVQTSQTFDLQPGTYEVTCKLEGRLDATRTITLEANDEKELTIPLPEVTDTAELYIATVPSGARIYLNNEVTTVMTNETIFLKKKDLGGEETGTVTIGLKLEDYEDLTLEVTISLGEKKRLEYALTEKDATTGKIRITSSPPNAKILIDDEDTNKLTQWTFDKPCKKTYKITLQLKDFDDFVFDSVWVYCDDTVQLHHEFEKEETKGKLKIVTTPPYADILKTSTKEKLGTTNMSAIELEQGFHFLTLRKKDYKNYEFPSVQIRAGHQTDLYAELTKGDPITGALYIMSDPPKATILLKDNKETERMVGYTATTVSDLSPGSYTVVLSKKQHISVSKTVVVVAGETIQVYEELEKIEMNSGLNIKSSPSNAKIFIDDEDTGFTTTKKIDLAARDEPYKISIQMDKFHPYIVNPMVVANRYKDVFATLEPLEEEVGTVKITSSPSSAYVKVDGQDVYRVTTTTLKLDPKPNEGQYIISVSKRGYVTEERAITIVKAKHLDIHIELEKEEEEEDTGMEIRSSPSNAMISIITPGAEGEEEEGIAEETGRRTPETLKQEPGIYIVQVTRAGWHPMTKTIRVVEGEITEEFFDLEEIETEEDKKKREKEEEEEAAKVHGVPEGWPWTLTGGGGEGSEQSGMSSLFSGGEEEDSK